MKVLSQQSRIQGVLVHSGQHYSDQMSRVFFEQLSIPQPHIDLGVGSHLPARQVGEIMIRFQSVLEAEAPELVIVVGDVNTTLACALTAVKMDIPIAHVEAGLRSFDRSMPEEINRILTDAAADFLFTTEGSAGENLLREGISKEKIFFVGNTMIDTLIASWPRIACSKILQDLHLEKSNYIVMTLHRPSNVDHEVQLKAIFSALKVMSESFPIIFPAHPRTQKQVQAFGIRPGDLGHLRMIPPLGYIDFLHLVSHSRGVITDSGGIQEETTYLGIPCLTLRQSTERPVTVTHGTNRVIGDNPQVIERHVKEVMNELPREKGVIPLWDGKAAERIIKVLSSKLKVLS